MKIRPIAGTGSSDLRTKILQQSLRTWSERSCRRLAADLSEMTVERATSG